MIPILFFTLFLAAPLGVSWPIDGAQMYPTGTRDTAGNREYKHTSYTPKVVTHFAWAACS